VAIKEKLIPALERLRDALTRHARDWDNVIKVGRTHLMDATPIRMGQVFSGYAWQATVAVPLAQTAQNMLARSLPIGGTAVGTGINTHADFGRRVSIELSDRIGIECAEAVNHFESQAALLRLVDAHARLKTIAISLTRIANDIRLLGSGPRCGLGELILPAIQPGSSIMPGKVNPVMCEAVIQVACRVVGNDATITMAATGGVGSIFELNMAMPVMGEALIESINLLARATDAFTARLVVGLQVDRERCRELVERSLMMVTSLAPQLGYDAAAKLAKEAMETGLTIRELVLEKKLMDPAQLDALLDPRAMTEPGGEGSSGG
jgi:fumarate hydratase class II